MSLHVIYHRSYIVSPVTSQSAIVNHFIQILSKVVHRAPICLLFSYYHLIIIIIGAIVFLVFLFFALPVCLSRSIVPLRLIKLCIYLEDPSLSFSDILITTLPYLDLCIVLYMNPTLNSYYPVFPLLVCEFISVVGNSNFLT